MKRLISLMVVALLAMPVVALAGPGFGRGFGPGFKQLNPVMVKKVLTDAGCSDQQVRRVQVLIDETKRKTLDIRHELEKARMDVVQMMQSENPDRAAIFKQIDRIGDMKLRLKKLWVGTILDVRKELTAEQWDKLQMLKADRMIKRRKQMRQRFKAGRP
jgi:Spy/CpxP family protein refolding chaperone